MYIDTNGILRAIDEEAGRISGQKEGGDFWLAKLRVLAELTRFRDGLVGAEKEAVVRHLREAGVKFPVIAEALGTTSGAAWAAYGETVTSTREGRMAAGRAYARANAAAPRVEGELTITEAAAKLGTTRERVRRATVKFPEASWHKTVAGRGARASVIRVTDVEELKKVLSKRLPRTK